MNMKLVDCTKNNSDLYYDNIFIDKNGAAVVGDMRVLTRMVHSCVWVRHTPHIQHSNLLLAGGQKLQYLPAMSNVLITMADPDALCRYQELVVETSKDNRKFVATSQNIDWDQRFHSRSRYGAHSSTTA